MTEQRPTHLMDLLYYGAKRSDWAPARRRLVELGLVDEAIAHSGASTTTTTVASSSP